MEITFNPSIPLPIIIPNKDTTFVDKIGIPVIVPEGYTTVYYTVDGSEPFIGATCLFSSDTFSYTTDSSITLRAITGKKLNVLEWEKGEEMQVKFQRIAPTPMSNVWGNYLVDTLYLIQNGEFAFLDSVGIIIHHSNLNDFIFYTTDGTVPDSSSFLYTGPFKIYKTSTIKTIAFGRNSIPSEVSEREYLITHSVGINKVMPSIKSKTINSNEFSYSVNGKKLRSLKQKAKAVYIKPKKKIVKY